MSPHLTPGFADAHESQRCFRAILQAISRPGRIVGLDVTLEPPAPLSPAAAACLLTLTDAMTSVALPESAAPWLVFHTGARLAPPAEADFTVSPGRPRLAGLPRGTDEAPERGATLIADVQSLDTGRDVRLSGPGIATPITVHLPLDADFIHQWRDQHERAPCGVDVILCAGHRLIGLPRSLMIEAL
ncbi:MULTISPECIES: phosphonate C-P lyase system protein PhnH [Acidiphilium]|uniref:Alpha-D-ribose 1-methylphosphonate 5-triphosphate synthase subunit PhnH n=1 Tax=Acidiphilium rubrum TaxID=526 RepID=A0A8G2CHT8_ACIRU|nr:MULTISPECIES: phosphonate C-P lyase system protein PhnH [Acidiphilium]SIQ10776.1 alpha-D-ribose 1-methylphosphonate 5-triphosphate synthase subunit PhnH [Acidiphilium rubrum]